MHFDFIWHWLQLTIVSFWIIALLLASRLHGRPKNQNINFWAALVNIFFLAFILYMGGFFTQGCG